MQAAESEKRETSGAKNQENMVRIDILDESGEYRGGEGSKFNTIIDVSGKSLDFPLGSGDENTAKEVYMYKNELNLIPRDVGRLKGLKTLKFFANDLNVFPGEFGNLVELECLQVKVTEPGVSGLELSKLGDLKELELSRVPPRPSAFPILRDIAGLKRLSRLTICHFSMRYLPPEIGCLGNLEYLDLSFNKMRNLPDEITFLKLLVSLKMNNNKLVELPLGFPNLEKLESLDLSNNRLTSIECLELESMRSLQSLNLQHNQLSDYWVPSWICCNFAGNARDLDESAEMDVYEGSPFVQSSHLSGLSPNHRSLDARNAKGWKRRYNLHTKARQERLNKCRRWKGVASRNSVEKCTTCRVVEHSDGTLPDGSSIVVDAELDCKDQFPSGNAHESATSQAKDVTSDKRSMNDCACSASDSVSFQSSAVLGTVSNAVEVHDEGSSSDASSSCLIKCKRPSEKDLDNPKPSKYRKSTTDPHFLSCQYSRTSFCGTGDHLPDGFYDAGRDRPFMPLQSYESSTYINTREVILLDREKDEDLDAILLRARALVRRFRQIKSSVNQQTATEILQTASLLALFVSDHFGGSDKSDCVQKARKSASAANYGKPFVCTCATGISCDTHKANKGMDTLEENFFFDVCEKSLHSIKEKRNSFIVPIGCLHFGICRHRALLMKYLCDRMEPQIPCELVRGYLDFTPHAWNVVVVMEGDSSVHMIVDACRPHDIREESDPEYFCRYIPLSQVNAVVEHDAGSKCAFPSLTACDEIRKLASTSLMRCNIGSQEAVVKVRTIDICSASADEVRNFELSCLGEVRMLRVLNHSCIVELYGHQISSKWSMTPDGNCQGRSLQSAILMEEIKGGSLRNYVEKLSSDGEKHVALDLALSIARDVAFALTEIHSKSIIHRDIKSENILIDLEKRRQDGTPIVKICDFDRAVPLHSYLHTCCIAHLGVHPPNVCIGTPRWMAPEVYYTMDKQSLYGLEVDIWSFGCVLLELLTLKVPYDGLPESEIHNLLQAGERPKLTDEMEQLARSDNEVETESETLKFLTRLFHQCTEKKLSDRPSAKKIYDLLVARTRWATERELKHEDIASNKR